MSELNIALLAAGAAIFSSAFTSYLTYYFQRRLHKRENELKWLEERFSPALDFLGRVSAIISNTPKTLAGRKQIVEEIHNIIVGPLKENNAWCIAVLLDPEDSGLRDLVFSTMTYARIVDSDNEFVNYQVRLRMNLEALAEEFRKERQAIVSGKSIETLIKNRKSELEKTANKLGEVLNVVRAFLKSEIDLTSTIRKVERSNIRGARLDWIMKIVGNDNIGEKEKQDRLKEIFLEMKNRKWL